MLFGGFFLYSNASMGLKSVPFEALTKSHQCCQVLKVTKTFGAILTSFWEFDSSINMPVHKYILFLLVSQPMLFGLLYVYDKEM